MGKNEEVKALLAQAAAKIASVERENAELKSKLAAAPVVAAASLVATSAPTQVAAVTWIAVRQSAIKPTNVEIVFNGKPSEEIRAELKNAGFRWAHTSKCWYGPRVTLPARYTQTNAA